MDTEHGMTERLVVPYFLLQEKVYNNDNNWHNKSAFMGMTFGELCDKMQNCSI